MRRWRVIIPSYKRAGKVRSFKLFEPGTVSVVVPRDQVDDYAAAQPELSGALTCLTEDCDGRGMAVKRNAILNAYRDELDVVMVDDDVRGYGRWQGGVLQQLDAAQVTAMIETGYDLARQLGVAIWSPNIKADPRAYSKMRPFSLLAPVLGPFTAVNRAVLGARRYDTRFYAKEDYDFWLQCLYHERRTLRLNQFCFVKREEGTGGLSRSNDQEHAEARLIEQKWGSVIRYNAMKSVLDARVQIPIPGC